MVDITADQIKSETGYGDDITDTNLEYLIDKAINWVNLNAGTSMSNMSGTAGSKSVTVTSDEGPVVKAWIELLMRAYFDKGPQGGVAPLNVAEITTDPHYKMMVKMANMGINRLRGRSFERT